MSTELKPCPFCGLGGEKAGAHTDDCYFSLSAALRVAPKGDLSLVPDILTAWNRRASPAAAVPEGALPPLPKSHHKAGDFDSYADVYEPHEVQHIVRAAVEADRAQRRPRVQISPEMKAAIDKAHETGSTIAETPHGIAFINYGHDYGDNAHLECTACGGSGHIEDQRTIAAADRAQQGEPVAVKKINMAQAGVGERARGYCAGWNDCVDELSRAAKAAAPADALDESSPYTAADFMRAAIDHIDAGRLPRAKRCINEALRLAAPVPDTGIPTAGEVELRAALKPFADAYAPEAERVARFYTPDDLAKYGDAFDRNTVTPAVTMGDFRRAYEAFRAPISTTPTSGEVEKAGPRTYMTDEQAEKWAWEQVKDQVGTKGWTAGESGTYYGFFLWGWRYREQYESQRAGEDA